MKKVICLCLALCLALCALGGCGKKEEKGENSSPSLGEASTVPTVSPTAPPVQKAKAVRVKADDGLNVRSSASTEGEILGLAENDALLPLVVDEEKDGWYQIQYEGKSAYVSADYAEITEITLEEYNRLMGVSSSNGASGSSPRPSLSPSASPASQQEPVSSAPESNGGDDEDGE